METGVFLTRDPIGYGDGPNVYCYVHCNPITHFDPLGLEISSKTEKDEDGFDHTKFVIDAAVIFDPALKLNKKEQAKRVATIKAGIEDAFTGEDKDEKRRWSVTVNLTITQSAKKTKEGQQIINVTSHGLPNQGALKGGGGKYAGAVWVEGGNMMLLDYNYLKNDDSSFMRTAGHEMGHLAGLYDHDLFPIFCMPKETRFIRYKNKDKTYGTIMTQTYYKYDIPEGFALSNELSPLQVKYILTFRISFSISSSLGFFRF